MPNISTPTTTTAGSRSPQTHANVLVTRTFSKIYGLAGERIGWAIGRADVIAAMHRIRAPFNVTTAGQAAALAALGDDGVRRRTAATHNRAMARAGSPTRSRALGNHGLRAVPSKANFVLVLFEGALTAEAAYKGLMERGLYRPLAARAGPAARPAHHHRHRGRDARRRRGARASWRAA